MKIIDLLNQIANGEEVPEKIKFKAQIYKFVKAENRYYEEDNIDQSDGISLGHHWALDGVLNDEVEIIKEDKKIEKMDRELNCDDDTIRGLVASVNEIYKEIVDKINEIIDKLNELGDKKE